MEIDRSCRILTNQILRDLDTPRIWMTCGRCFVKTVLEFLDEKYLTWPYAACYNIAVSFMEQQFSFSMPRVIGNALPGRPQQYV